MSWLSKSLKKAGKAIGKAHQPLLRGALTVATGGLSGKAESVLKTLGVSKRGRVLKSEQADILRTAAMPTAGYPQRAPAAPAGLVQVTPPPKPKRRVAVTRRKAKAPRSPAKAKTGARQGGRRPPTGGLDLKAISARWRAAGKPGRWIDFVKASR